MAQYLLVRDHRSVGGRVEIVETEFPEHGDPGCGRTRVKSKGTQIVLDKPEDAEDAHCIASIRHTP